MKVKVSVIVAAYNVAAYLEKCLNSILNQTYRNLEIIIVDDGSRDNTGKICDEFVEKDCRVRVIHKKNEGSVRARYDGLNAATGEYIYFVDGDDWLCLGVIDSLVSSLVDNTVDIVISNYAYYVEGRKREVLTNFLPGIYTGIRLENIKKCFISKDKAFEFGINPSLWNKLFKIEIVKKYYDLIPADIAFGDDFAIFVPCFLFCTKVVFIKTDQVYCYQIRRGSIINSYDDKMIEKIICLKQYFDNSPWQKTIHLQMNKYWAMVTSKLIYNQMSLSNEKNEQLEALKKITKIPGLMDDLKEIDKNDFLIPLRYQILPLINNDIRSTRVRYLAEKKIRKIREKCRNYMIGVVKNEC